MLLGVIAAEVLGVRVVVLGVVGGGVGRPRTQRNEPFVLWHWKPGAQLWRFRIHSSSSSHIPVPAFRVYPVPQLCNLIQVYEPIVLSQRWDSRHSWLLIWHSFMSIYVQRQWNKNQKLKFCSRIYIFFWENCVFIENGTENFTHTSIRNLIQNETNLAITTESTILICTHLIAVTWVLINSTFIDVYIVRTWIRIKEIQLVECGRERQRNKFL